VELHELHPATLGTNRNAERKAVSGRHAGVGGVPIHASTTAGREHNGVDVVGSLAHSVDAGFDAAALAVFNEEPGDKGAFNNGDPGVCADGLDHRAFNFPTGPVEEVDNAVHAVATFASKGKAAL
jgi:hypothetical protein